MWYFIFLHQSHERRSGNPHHCQLTLSIFGHNKRTSWRRDPSEVQLSIKMAMAVKSTQDDPGTTDARCHHFVHIRNASQTIDKGFCMLRQYSSPVVATQSTFGQELFATNVANIITTHFCRNMWCLVPSLPPS